MIKIQPDSYLPFEFIKGAIRAVFPSNFEALTIELIKLLIFDAIVGNNDRHFYNWGVIDSKKKTSKLPTFAPIYDSARGLLWNHSDENLRKLLTLHKQGSNRLYLYIENASPRISIEDNKTANHFQLIDFIGRHNNEYQNIINELISVENERAVMDMLDRDFYPMFISERCELITVIIRERFKKLRVYDEKSI